MVDMDTTCLTEFLKTKDISLDDFKKMDHKSEEYKKAYEGYEEFFEEWKEKRKEKNSSQQDNSKNKPLVINEGDAKADEENSHSEEIKDASWKEKIAQEWKVWGTKNKLEYQDASIPSKGDGLCFRFRDGSNEDYAAEINYSSPYNLSIKGCNGKTPDSKYFEKAVSMAVANGTAIEFGNISSPEFKAKLLAACYKQGNIQIVNGPSAEEMASWPEELKKMIEEAKAAAPQQTQQEEKTPSQEDKTHPKQEEQELSPAQKRIAELRKQIQNRQSKLEAAAKDISPEERKAIEQEGMTAEEIKLRELRGQAKEGDKKAGHELDAHRYNTMTDEFKYKRLMTVENGKEVPVKDDNGKDIYLTDDKGKKIKTDAYKAFLAKAGNNLGR